MADSNQNPKGRDQRRGGRPGEAPKGGGEADHGGPVPPGFGPNPLGGGGVADLVRELVRDADATNQAASQNIDIAAQIIGALMGRFKNKKITAEAWARAEGARVQIDDDADGGKVIRVRFPAQEG